VQVLADGLSERRRGVAHGYRPLPRDDPRAVHVQVRRVREAARADRGESARVLHHRRQGRQDARESGAFHGDRTQSRRRGLSVTTVLLSRFNTAYNNSELTYMTRFVERPKRSECASSERRS